MPVFGLLATSPIAHQSSSKRPRFLHLGFREGTRMSLKLSDRGGSGGFYRLPRLDHQGICNEDGCIRKTWEHPRVKGKYLPWCYPCYYPGGPEAYEKLRTRKRVAAKKKIPFGPRTKPGFRTNRAYRKHVKEFCEACGFVALNVCQLDVDHIDGNRFNDDPSNLMTLCACCHRMKTLWERNSR